MMKNDLLDMILDAENHENLVLNTADGKQLVFEQIATIPYQDHLYTVLRPLSDDMGLNSEEVIVFRVEVSDDEAVIYPEEVYTAVYAVYQHLLEEQE